MRNEWALEKAWRETTPTRERICLNGLWRWQPAQEAGEIVPEGGWGWFKVPGCWPGISDYMQKDSQAVIPHPSWKGVNMGALTTAWYQREFTVPRGWEGRRITLAGAYVNSLAIVFVDGERAGHISFPSGEVELTDKLKPGETHTLSIQLVALPLSGVIASYSDTNSAKQMKATVPRRGLCGDVYLVSSPAKARIERFDVQPSVRNWTVTVRADLAALDPSQTYRLQAKITDQGQPVQTLTGDPFRGTEGRATLVRSWKPGKLWDIHTPQNQYDMELTLLDAADKALDVQAPKRFGFRELWIDGRDFMLNGTRIFWSCVPMDNAQVSAGLSSYEGAKESMRRLKSFGINMVYTHNYDCNPGSYLSFEEILRAADDVGLLVAFTQPHFGNYDWSAQNAEQTNDYARHAAFFAQVAGSHPSVIAYSTSHNACGYNEDMNPDLIDGVYDKRDNWALNNMRKAVRAEAIIGNLDPSRIVYHHSSGNLGSMHTMNFYVNMAPIQELDDWFEHWATQGVKPAFTVEYGVPFSWDWSMYRGWYQGQRSFGSAMVPWDYCMAEWNAQFLGDAAFSISEAEKRNLRWEAQKVKARQLWHRWDYPYPMGSTNPGFEDQQRVWAQYTADNWRAFRTWGVSGISPWETHSVFWRLREGVKRERVDLKTDWDNLQRPGYSADFVDQRYERRDLAFEDSDWEPTTGGRALIRNNRHLLAYIGGKVDEFTEKGHNFRAGETVQKQLIVVNNSRESVDCECSWSLGPLSGLKGGTAKFKVPTGAIHKQPLSFALPSNLKAGMYHLTATVEFAASGFRVRELARALNPSGLPRVRTPNEFGTSQGGEQARALPKGPANGAVETQEDEFTIHVLPPPPRMRMLAKLAIYDPKGETTKLLRTLGVNGVEVKQGADLSGYDTVVIGKGALTTTGPGLDLARVRDGLKVLVFEQTAEVLEQRLGFRVQEYGLRNVFPRVPGHPTLAGLDADGMRDWRGAATLIPPRLQYQLADQFNGAPAIVRTGQLVTRAWRCGNRGNVASVLIEKPAAGDFLPLVDGGFSLQYSPLLEYREGKGLVLFCQMDVTGRTESDPAAAQLVANLLNNVSSWKPAPQRELVYAGELAGRQHLERAGFAVGSLEGVLKPRGVLAIGPGGSVALTPYRGLLATWLKGGGRALALGLEQSEIAAALPVPVTTRSEEYIAATFEPPAAGSPLAGIGPADVYNRDPRAVPLITNRTRRQGVLAATDDGSIVFLQLTPWAFDQTLQNGKRVFRHTSVAVSRLLGNLGVHASTPLLVRFSSPVIDGAKEQRWLSGFYLDTPEAWDDPYRFFRW